MNKILAIGKNDMYYSENYIFSSNALLQSAMIFVYPSDFSCLLFRINKKKITCQMLIQTYSCNSPKSTLFKGLIELS